MKQKFQVHIKRKASSLRMSKDFMSFSLASIIFFPWVLINNMTMTLFSETKEQNPCGGWDLSSLSTWPQSNLKLYQYNSQPLKQQPHMQHRMRNERKKLKNKLIQSHYESHSSINLKCMWQLASKIPLSLSLSRSLSLSAKFLSLSIVEWFTRKPVATPMLPSVPLSCCHLDFWVPCKSCNCLVLDFCP